MNIIYQFPLSWDFYFYNYYSSSFTALHFSSLFPAVLHDLFLPFVVIFPALLLLSLIWAVFAGLLFKFCGFIYRLSPPFFFLSRICKPSPHFLRLFLPLLADFTYFERYLHDFIWITWIDLPLVINLSYIEPYRMFLFYGTLYLL